MTNNQLTKEWLQNRIAYMESTRDDIPFGFDEIGNNELAAFKLALAAMDSEPDRNPALAYADSYRDMAKQGVESVPIWSVITDLERNIAPLYRRAQPSPVVPDDVLEALQKVARIRLDLNDFDGDHRGLSFCLSDAEETLIDVVNRRADMFAAAMQSPGGDHATVPGKWIPVSERMPPSRHEVLVGRWWGENPRWCCKWATYIPGHPDSQSSGWLIPGASWTPTHWMPLPAAPQEVKS
ncbi:hypothetical protein vBKpnSMK54_60 [Klebsiella phage vB_KpnS_MK54]|uniref:hypothetical protein n=1 Tax=Klebsiella phage vB_KpnS_MK54 TaxID=2783667 RepID=UPI001CE65DF2|nr:hypothetical protein PRB83_gp60 [Klebsiella phage vB_KpnS_MK54]QZD26102.1 hypothetical protein vBKpnSMK54_60 [Klebsiella phage vB_KpnS_MK54]